MPNENNVICQSLGALLMARAGAAEGNEKSTHDSTSSELNFMTEEAYCGISDPAPGSDPAWDSLTESEKAYFRNPPVSNGKTFSDLLRDRHAIDMQAASELLG